MRDNNVTQRTNDAHMRLHVLASGSKGNATIVENVVTGEGILIDCGILSLIHISEPTRH